MKRRFATSIALAALTVLSASRLGAQVAPPSQPPQTVAPPFKLEVIANTDSAAFDNIFALHVLSDGSILAVDASRRRMVLIDPSMKNLKILADTAPGAPEGFGQSQGGLISFAGDSAAFVDQSTGSLVTVDKNGKFGRITALPHLSDARFLGGPLYGKPGFDVKGRLLYRTVFPTPSPAAVDGRVVEGTVVVPRDSAPVIRVNFDTRQHDTVAMIRIATATTKFVTSDKRTFATTILNPVPVLDDWAYDRDGTVAVVRSGDYHIDWYLPDGSKKSTPKMPFNWRRITDIEKTQIIDSLKHQSDSSRQVNMERTMEYAKKNGATPPTFAPPTQFVAPAELPDYYPALKPNSRPRFDLDGNIWVLPGTTMVTAVDGGLLYDVIDRTGTVVKRVQLPPNRILSAFGKGGIVYMIVPTASGMWTRIERAKIVP